MYSNNIVNFTIFTRITNSHNLLVAFLWSDPSLTFRPIGVSILRAERNMSIWRKPATFGKEFTYILTKQGQSRDVHIVVYSYIVYIDN